MEGLEGVRLGIYRASQGLRVLGLRAKGLNLVEFVLIGVWLSPNIGGHQYRSKNRIIVINYGDTQKFTLTLRNPRLGL